MKKRALEALCPWPEVRQIPYGLVDLRDMINFTLQSLLWALLLLRQEAAVAGVRATKDPQGNLSGEDLKRFRSNFDSIAEPLRALGVSEGRVGRLSSMSRLGTRYTDVLHELTALDSDILDAAALERFYHYPRDKSLLVVGVDGNWHKVIKAFPSAGKDVRAAVDCYALGHPRASIYHSMMILERGLPLLAKKLRVKVDKDRGTWAPIIDDIRGEIDRRRVALGRTPKGSKPLSAGKARAEKRLVEPCQDAAMEFRYFADVWRNHIAHGRGDYEEDDAKRVLEHVKTFMEIIAEKLKLKE